MRSGTLFRSLLRSLGRDSLVNCSTLTYRSREPPVWNEEVSPTRRYVVIIRVSADDTIVGVKVVTGDILAGFDTTGTLTQKYQARLVPAGSDAELVSGEDTDKLAPFVRRRSIALFFLVPLIIQLPVN